MKYKSFIFNRVQLVVHVEIFERQRRTMPVKASK
jgi:hypothetical protein